MRIAISSTQCNGKTTLVNAIKQRWPNYELPEKTYRDVIKEKGLSINQEGTKESQELILNALVDQAINNSHKKHTLSDRSVLDNVVYTLWLGDKEKITDTDFIANSINICRETLKMYDIIFWLPLNEDISVKESDSGQRALDEEYRIEIDNIFFGVFESYKAQEGVLFDREDQPAFIPLEGDVSTKLSIIAQYIDDDGDLIENTSSVFSDMEDLYLEQKLREEISQ